MTTTAHEPVEGWPTMIRDHLGMPGRDPDGCASFRPTWDTLAAALGAARTLLLQPSCSDDQLWVWRCPDHADCTGWHIATRPHPIPTVRSTPAWDATVRLAVLGSYRQQVADLCRQLEAEEARRDAAIGDGLIQQVEANRARAAAAEAIQRAAAVEPELRSAHERLDQLARDLAGARADLAASERQRAIDGGHARSDDDATIDHLVADTWAERDAERERMNPAQRTLADAADLLSLRREVIRLRRQLAAVDDLLLADADVQRSDDAVDDDEATRTPERHDARDREPASPDSTRSTKSRGNAQRRPLREKPGVDDGAVSDPNPNTPEEGNNA